MSLDIKHLKESELQNDPFYKMSGLLILVFPGLETNFYQNIGIGLHFPSNFVSFFN